VNWASARIAGPTRRPKWRSSILGGPTRSNSFDRVPNHAILPARVRDGHGSCGKRSADSAFPTSSHSRCCGIHINEPARRGTSERSGRVVKSSVHETMGSLTRMSVGSGDFKFYNKGRRINVYLIRRPFPFPRSTRSALRSEEYGHPGGHLSRRARPELRLESTDSFSDTLVLDGTYRSAENDPHLWFRPAPPPESGELERVLQRVVRGIVRVIEGVARPEWVG